MNTISMFVWTVDGVLQVVALCGLALVGIFYACVWAYFKIKDRWNK